MNICGAITNSAAGAKQRCVEDVLHRGPHWTNAEPLNCTCKNFCMCPATQET